MEQFQGVVGVTYPGTPIRQASFCEKKESAIAADAMQSGGLAYAGRVRGWASQGRMCKGGFSSDRLGRESKSGARSLAVSLDRFLDTRSSVGQVFGIHNRGERHPGVVG
jgi:hypothetical protein